MLNHTNNDISYNNSVKMHMQKINFPVFYYFCCICKNDFYVVKVHVESEKVVHKMHMKPENPQVEA